MVIQVSVTTVRVIAPYFNRIVTPEFTSVLCRLALKKYP